MRAVLCKAYGPPESLVIEEVEDPTPATGEIVVAVDACGVNFPDTLIIEGKYQYKPPLPFSPGCEVAGSVAAVGTGVERFAVGDRVLAFPGWGGFAEQVAVKEKLVVPLPGSIDSTQAAGFMLTYGTVYHALNDRGALQSGETLLVLGAAGGVGMAAIDVGKALGAKVIAAASTAEKLDLCRQYGADEVIDYSREDLKERAKTLGGGGVDVVLDPVGGTFAEPALRAIGWRGRYLVVGFAAGDIPRIPLNLLLLKGCALVGVFWGAFTEREPEQNRRDLEQLLQWLESGRLNPHISARYPLEQAAEALDVMRQRKVKGKLVITTRSTS